jgi:hypothetical protein
MVKDPVCTGKADVASQPLLLLALQQVDSMAVDVGDSPMLEVLSMSAGVEDETEVSPSLVMSPMLSAGT